MEWFQHMKRGIFSKMLLLWKWNTLVDTAVICYYLSNVKVSLSIYMHIELKLLILLQSVPVVYYVIAIFGGQTYQEKIKSKLILKFIFCIQCMYQTLLFVTNLSEPSSHFQNHLGKHALVFSENRKVLITFRALEFLRNQIFSDVQNSEKLNMAIH